LRGSAMIPFIRPRGADDLRMAALRLPIRCATTRLVAW
jgi:hypothetical protein